MTGLLVAGCSGHSNVISGQVMQPVGVDEVELFYTRLPDCEFEEVSVLQIPGGYFSPASLINAFRSQAARLGANAVHIHYMQRTGGTEYFGQARALRCNRSDSSVDSETSI